jgi:hypothetical protein
MHFTPINRTFTINQIVKEKARALFTKAQMGHRKIETTLIYTQLLNLNDNEWACKTAKTIEEAKALIESGFEYITEVDGVKLFKKRK